MLKIQVEGVLGDLPVLVDDQDAVQVHGTMPLGKQRCQVTPQCAPELAERQRTQRPARREHRAMAFHQGLQALLGFQPWRRHRFRRAQRGPGHQVADPDFIDRLRAVSWGARHSLKRKRRL